MRPIPRAALLALLPAALVACGDGKADTGQAAGTASTSAVATPASGGLSDFELKHGIGPVTEEVKLGPVDAALAQKGHELFEGSAVPATRPMSATWARRSAGSSSASRRPSS